MYKFRFASKHTFHMWLPMILTFPVRRPDWILSRVMSCISSVKMMPIG